MGAQEFGPVAGAAAAKIHPLGPEATVLLRGSFAAPQPQKHTQEDTESVA